MHTVSEYSKTLLYRQAAESALLKEIPGLSASGTALPPATPSSNNLINSYKRYVHMACSIAANYAPTFEFQYTRLNFVCASNI